MDPEYRGETEIKYYDTLNQNKNEKKNLHPSMSRLSLNDESKQVGEIVVSTQEHTLHHEH